MKLHKFEIIPFLITFSILFNQNWILGQEVEHEKYKSPIFSKEQKEENEKSYEFGYKGFLESGIVFKEMKFNKAQFGGGFTSHGVYLNNIYLGLGIGLDRYDSLWFRPIVLDARFTLSGSKKSSEDGTVTYRKTSSFLMFNIGKTQTINSDINQNLKGWVFNAGLGLLIGKQKDVRSTLYLMYRYQGLGKSSNTPLGAESLHIRLGVEFKTTHKI